MLKVVSCVSILALVATCAHAQGLPAGTLMRFQVWDGTQWSSTATAQPGSQFEYRITMSYTGTATDIVGLGSARYQPTFSNAVNTGDSLDTHAPFRNSGVNGNSIANSMLSAAEGASGAALLSYGRVVYGSTGMSTSSLNVLTQFRHGGGAPINNAPPGSYIRLAGSDVVQFPAPHIPSAEQATPGAINQIARGVPASQRSPIENNAPNPNFVAGIQDVVIFRGAMVLAAGNANRVMTISNADGSLLRGQYGSDTVSSADDTRYVMWWASTNDPISTLVTIESAQVQVVPAPSALGLLSAAGVWVTRRRRHA